MCPPRITAPKGNWARWAIFFEGEFFSRSTGRITPDLLITVSFVSPLGQTGSVYLPFLVYLAFKTLVTSDWLPFWDILGLSGCVSQTFFVDTGWSWSPRFLAGLGTAWTRWLQWLLLGGVVSWEETSEAARGAAGTMGKEWAWKGSHPLNSGTLKI